MRHRRDAAIEYDASRRERNRLAANLHDMLLQTLGGIDYQLGACLATSLTQGGEAEHLQVASRMVEHATKELRGSVWALRTVPLVGHSFTDSLETLLNQPGLSRSERLVFETTGSPSRAIPAAAPPCGPACSPATTMPTWKATIEGPPARTTRGPLLSEHQRCEASGTWPAICGHPTSR